MFEGGGGIPAGILAGKAGRSCAQRASSGRGVFPRECGGDHGSAGGGNCAAAACEERAAAGSASESCRLRSSKFQVSGFKFKEQEIEKCRNIRREMRRDFRRRWILRRAKCCGAGGRVKTWWRRRKSRWLARRATAATRRRQRSAAATCWEL